MRRIVLWFLSTVAGLVLLFTYRPGTSSTAPAVVALTPAATPSASSAASPDAAASAQATEPSGTYDGTLVQTSQGPVQVRITVSSGQIVDVTAVVYPSDSARHQQLSSYSLPVLREQALAAQSADIDTVSGATDTSEGYIESLQAAIDAAHLS